MFMTWLGDGDRTPSEERGPRIPRHLLGVKSFRSRRLMCGVWGYVVDEGSG